MRRQSRTRFGLGSGALSLLVFGTGSSLMGKVIYELQGPDRQGSAKCFRKPWASTAAMFLAMALCLPGAALKSFFQRLYAKKVRGPGEEGLEESLLGGQAASSESDQEPADVPVEAAPDKAGAPKQYAYILVPTVFDLIATVLMSVGLLYVTVSVYQMMRGVEVVFAALFSIAFLGRELNKLHVGGIFLALVGISLVGLASVMTGQGGSGNHASSKQMIIGMLLVVAAEAVQAAQVVVEDHFMSTLQFEPLTVVGYEGLYGFAIMVGLLLPLLQWVPGVEGAGLHEDTLETLHMVAHSRPLQMGMSLFVCTMAFYNIAGMMVTDNLGAVTRTVLETLRTLFVWLLDLLLYYGAPMGKGAKLGEPWTSSSWLQAVGFAVLVLGTLVYGWGEEVQEEELRKFAKLRARERWARIRASLQELTAAATRRMTHEEATPMRAPRIAGPARIRTAFLPVLFMHRLQGLARPRWGSLASRGHLEHVEYGSSGGRRTSLDLPRDHHHHTPHHSRPPSRPPSHPHSLAEVVGEVLAARQDGGAGTTGPSPLGASQAGAGPAV